MSVRINISSENGRRLFQGDTSSSLNSLNVSPAASPVLTCPVPTLPLPGLCAPKPDDAKQTPQSAILAYLFESYARVALEERNHPKKSSIPPLSDVLSDLRCQIVHHASLVLQGLIVERGCEGGGGKSRDSPLLEALLQQTLPRGFVSELVARTCQDEGVFSRIFGPVLQNLAALMQNASIASNEHRQPIQVRSQNSHCFFILLYNFLVSFLVAVFDFLLKINGRA